MKLSQGEIADLLHRIVVDVDDLVEVTRDDLDGKTRQHWVDEMSS